MAGEWSTGRVEKKKRRGGRDAVRRLITGGGEIFDLGWKFVIAEHFFLTEKEEEGDCRVSRGMGGGGGNSPRSSWNTQACEGVSEG